MTIDIYIKICIIVYIRNMTQAKEVKEMKKWQIGDKVVASMGYGYAPVHGVIEEIWVNEHGVEMASVNYGDTNKIDWMSNWHPTATTKSLKARG